jgi:hypothetical protein
MTLHKYTAMVDCKQAAANRECHAARAKLLDNRAPTAARQEEESQAVQPGQMLKRYRSRRYGLAAYWSGGTGS